MAKSGFIEDATPHLLIGAHLSIAGGLQEALYAGSLLGCTCIQIFTHNNRQWGMPIITPTDIKKFTEARKKTGITEIVVHASYLINLASSDSLVSKKSTTALRDELIRCETLQIPYLVLHPGSALTSSPEDAIERVSTVVKEIFNDVPYTHTQLLFENMAGQGTTLGVSLEELALILHKVAAPTRTGICIDTCHAFAAGYDISTTKGYKDFWTELNDIIGIAQLKAMHLNDSLQGCGSRVDRHTHIGHGKIGMHAFYQIMHDANLQTIPKILETPHDAVANDQENLNILRMLAASKTYHPAL